MPYLQRFMPEMESRVRGIGRGRRGFGEFGAAPGAEPVVVSPTYDPETGVTTTIVPSTGVTTTTAPLTTGIWRQKKANVSYAEVKTITDALYNFGYSKETELPRVENDIIIGGVRWSLRWLQFIGADGVKRIRDANPQSTRVYLPADEYDARVRAAIGFVRYFMNPAVWPTVWNQVYTEKGVQILGWWDYGKWAYPVEEYKPPDLVIRA